MRELKAPSIALHGEKDSVKVSARVAGTSDSGMPIMVVDIGELKGVPLHQLHKLEGFLTFIYDWRREHFAGKLGGTK